MSRTLEQRIAWSACWTALPPLAPRWQLPRFWVRRGNLLRRPLGWAGTSKVRQTGKRFVKDINLRHIIRFLPWWLEPWWVRDGLAKLTYRLSCRDTLPPRQLCHRSSGRRPQRWSIFQSNGMVNGFFQATIDFNGFSMVLTTLDHHHWMFFEGPTIGVNGFSMVFKILRAMVNDGFEVNDCLDVPLQKVRKINLRQNCEVM